jgi:hypothetical protein
MDERERLIFINGMQHALIAIDSGLSYEEVRKVVWKLAKAWNFGGVTSAAKDIIDDVLADLKAAGLPGYVRAIRLERMN